MRRVLRALFVVGVVVTVGFVLTGFWLRSELRASLPQLAGSRPLPGLTAAVTVRRDALGIPTVRGANRPDVARATGFLHGQDRFFQMDLSRRRAAGELAALVGPRALVADRQIRRHRFRAQAKRALSLLSSEDRSVLEAYTAGVNQGLQSLDAFPFEYLLLGQDPEPWLLEDSLLVVLSMFVTLQDEEGEYESTLATMYEVLPRELFEFMAPRGSEWDAPLVGPAFTVPPLPGPDVYNPRVTRRGHAKTPAHARRPAPGEGSGGPGSWLATPGPGIGGAEAASLGTWREADRWLGVGGGELGILDSLDEGAAIGSNGFAVAGRLSANGGALVASDMHLTIRVPNTWYRAALEWPDSSGGEQNRLIGVTLPGVPALVAGSNTHVAWGFTNTYADWSDLVLLDVHPEDADRYRTPAGWREFERFDEVIHVAGEPDQHQTVTWTIWGPVLGEDYRGRLRAYSWVAHSAERLAASITPLESARTVEEAFTQANGLGTPGQNLVVVDRSGRIGWSIYGAIPRRMGISGQLPSSWADGSKGWNGWLDPREYPRISDPPEGRIWTANARVVNGDQLAALGDGGYEIGSRARIIRDRLTAHTRPFVARDLLAIQLDAGADFLARWRQVILQTLTPRATAGRLERAEFRSIVDRDWTGYASPDSSAYRLTRTFREIVSERVWAFILADCYEADPSFDYRRIRRREGAIFALVTRQPLHMLDPAYETWEDLLVSAVDQTIEEALAGRSDGLPGRVWAEYNVTAYRHPLSGGVPLLGPWLDMPRQSLPGDLYTPRVQWGAQGASERMVVSPGREAEGIMHMPTGQSGHPLSPFYGNSHEAWVRGEPTPFLPGPPQHTLTLVP